MAKLLLPKSHIQGSCKARCGFFVTNRDSRSNIKDALYSMFGPDLVGLTVAVRNIVG